MKELMEAIGYTFRNPKYLITALTHPSYGSDHHVEHYQRLEFLGDAVLELCVSRELYFELPGVPEGKLTRIRAGLVREETLCEAAEKLGIGKCMRLSVGEERSHGRQKPSILADIMEAVIAAVYLDGGFDEAMKLVRLALGDQLTSGQLKDRLDDKSRLQEILQRDGRMPAYDFVSMEGPPHAPQFAYRVSADGEVLGEGAGSSKQQAQQAAARNALQRMGA